MRTVSKRMRDGVYILESRIDDDKIAAYIERQGGSDMLPWDLRKR
jgi:hypothetical protein